MKSNVVEVKVTKQHFAAAVKAETVFTGKSLIETCLLAQAVKSAFPRKQVDVGNFSISVGSGSTKKEYKLDDKGMKLIVRFDNGSAKTRKTLLAYLPTTFKMTLEA